MKATQLKTATKGIVISVFAVLIGSSLGSCAKNFSFMTSPVVPAARGKVKVTRDHNKNYVLQVEIFNLAEVERLQPSKKTYVVWMVSDDEITKNIGQLKSSTAMFSKQLKASLKTVSASKPIKVIVSAEDDAGAEYPGNQVVLSTDRFLNR
jgi:hypothetical protein